MTHEQRQAGDRQLDVLTDDAAGLRIVVSRLGAELISVARRSATDEWIGFLYRDGELAPPASGWANHATVMGYFLHRLKNERSLYRGQEITGGTHSFLRHKIWRNVEVGADAITYRMTPDEFTAPEYPLPVSLELTYTLDHGGVRVSFHFTNAEPERSAHVGFGLHPGFAASSFTSWRLQMPAGRYRRYLVPGNFLSGETEVIDHAGGEMPFPRETLPGSIILEFIDVPAREFIYEDAASGRRVALGLTETPFVTLWSDGGPFVCVEPCWGLTDHHEQRPFERKAGIQEIAPGGELRASFALVPTLVR